MISFAILVYCSTSISSLLSYMMSHISLPVLHSLLVIVEIDSSILSKSWLLIISRRSVSSCSSRSIIFCTTVFSIEYSLREFSLSSASWYVLFSNLSLSNKTIQFYMNDNFLNSVFYSSIWSLSTNISGLISWKSCNSSSLIYSYSDLTIPL